MLDGVTQCLETMKQKGNPLPITPMQGDICSLPLKSGSLDGIFSTEAIEHVREATLARGKALGIPCASAAAALGYAKQGYTFIPVGADTWWVTAAATAAATELGLDPRGSAATRT